MIDLVALRRELHQIPEVGLQLPETQARSLHRWNIGLALIHLAQRLAHEPRRPDLRAVSTAAGRIR